MLLEVGAERYPSKPINEMGSFVEVRLSFNMGIIWTLNFFYIIKSRLPEL